MACGLAATTEDNSKYSSLKHTLSHASTALEFGKQTVAVAAAARAILKPSDNQFTELTKLMQLKASLPKALAMTLERKLEELGQGKKRKQQPGTDAGTAKAEKIEKIEKTEQTEAVPKHAKRAAGEVPSKKEKKHKKHKQ